MWDRNERGGVDDRLNLTRLDFFVSTSRNLEVKGGSLHAKTNNAPEESVSSDSSPSKREESYTLLPFFFLCIFGFGMHDRVIGSSPTVAALR